MKISTKGRYALRLMLDVALHSHGAAVPLRDVAQRQEISDKYLEQIVTQLSRAGLVRSVRGAGGGYLLTREPEEYTVGEILRVHTQHHTQHPLTQHCAISVTSPTTRQSHNVSVQYPLKWFGFSLHLVGILTRIGICVVPHHVQNVVN